MNRYQGIIYSAQFYIAIILTAIYIILSGELTIEGVIKQHRGQVITGDPDKPYRITVRRSNILEDTLDELRFGFDESKYFRVTFMGDPAVDQGGPRREYFMLLMGTIANSGSLLDGPPDRRILRHNANAFQVRMNIMICRFFYFVVFRMNSICILER